MDEQEKKIAKLTVRLDAVRKAALDAMREVEHRSLHAEIMKAIDEHIAQWESGRHGR